MNRQIRRTLLLLVGGPILLACNNKIGDPCEISTDCGIQFQQRNRECDLSQSTLNPSGEGECTIQNCSRGSCPDQNPDAICIKAYPAEFLSTACDPEREDIAVNELPPLDDCAAHEICLPEGLCADELSARSSCRLKCSSDRDCRRARDSADNYVCRRTGYGGVYWAPDPDDPRDNSTTKYCAPPFR